MSSNGHSQAPTLILDEFLVADELNGLMDYTLGRQRDFAATQLVNAQGGHHVDTTYRRSRVLFDLGWYRDVFVNRISTFLPVVFQRLGYEWFPVRNIEVQLTATSNGEFFRRHNDNGTDAVRSRSITFVYFFYREPRPFSGGELRVYNTCEDREAAESGFNMIVPEQNQIIFFVSEYIHEILPVQCPAGDFSESRFTVNGWLHR
jgi:Rps23 Pro-64 3,4-dihydroxylase Tpa1-like proline 4-hydroxylase